MDHYCDIKILENPEISQNHIRNTLFGAFHLALVNAGYRDVGISFPEVKDKSLGSLLRIHGSEGALRNLVTDNWWRGMRDYIDLFAVNRIPQVTKYRKVLRVQAKSSPTRLRRRLERRQGITLEEAEKKIPNSIARKLELPYLQISSKSSGHDFLLFVQHGPLMDERQTGLFNSYGLSTGGSVPWF
jgi:CRISPR-associated endonuclease Csy4